MNIRVDGVHEAMLKEFLKKWRMKPEDYIQEKIQEDYAVFNKRKR